MSKTPEEREETRCKICSGLAYAYFDPYQIICVGCAFKEEDCACRE